MKKSMDRDLLEHILEVSRHMAETRSLAALLTYAMDEAIDLSGAERGFIVLAGSDGSLDFRVKRDRTGQDLDHPEDQVSKTVLNRVLNRGEPIILRNAMGDPQFSDVESVVILGLRSIMCVPLISRGETIGAIYVENRSIRGRFGEEDLPPLILFGNQAAVAIENARLIDNLEGRVAARTEELERAKQHLEQGWFQAVESNRLRMEWLSKITHDLRASLGIASGALSVLQEGMLGELSAEQRNWVDKSLEAVLLVRGLADDLFDLSILETGGLTLSKETVELEGFLGKVYEIGLGLPWPETVKLSLDLPTSLPPVAIDSLRIRQVLFNLLSNAHKFTTQGRVTIYARCVRRQADPDEVLIGVVDTGEGIPAAEMDRVFERFQQIDLKSERRQLGSGLGLAICRELVEMHGGRIWVESKLDAGSDFKFTLPVQSPAC
jgi:signal transduction histidine kinase